MKGYKCLFRQLHSAPGPPKNRRNLRGPGPSPLLCNRYDSVFVQRTGGRRDGCATFWHAQRLHATHVRRLRFHDYDLSDNVALLVALQPLWEGADVDESGSLSQHLQGVAGEGGAAWEAGGSAAKGAGAGAGGSGVEGMGGWRAESGGGAGAAAAAGGLSWATAGGAGEEEEEVGLLVANTHVSSRRLLWPP